MRKTLVVAVLAVGVATCATARGRVRSSEAQYRIQIRDASGVAYVLAKDQPATHGSVVMFHRHPDGRLTSVPAEEVTGIAPFAQSAAIPVATATTTTTVRRRTTRTAAQTAASADAQSHPLAPGEAMVIGTTGDGATGINAATANPTSPSTPVPANASAAAGIQNKQALESQVFPGDLPAPGAGASGNASSSPVYGGAPTGTQPVMGGSAAAAANPVGSNGFPAVTTAPQNGTTPINPNGFPATTTTGPQSGTNPIDPNGFPATTTTGPQAGAAQPIGPNGFPTTSPNTTTTAPNGTPATAAPNGTAPAQGQTAVPAKGSTVNAGSGHK